MGWQRGMQRMKRVPSALVGRLAKNDIIGQARFIERAFGIAVYHNNGT